MRETIIPYNVECEEQRPLLTNAPTNTPRQDENIPEALEQWSFTKLEDQMDKAQLRLLLFQSEAKCRQLEAENKRLKELVQNNAGSHKEESVKSPERAPIHEEVFQIVAYLEYPPKVTGGEGRGRTLHNKSGRGEGPSGTLHIISGGEWR